MPQQPGWYNVAGKGERYWDGKNYRFYGPSGTAASKGQGKISSDVGGMFNNIVDAFGRTTSDPSKVGQQRWQQQGYKSMADYQKAMTKARETSGQTGSNMWRFPWAKDQVKPSTPTPVDKRTGSVDSPTKYPTRAELETIKPSRDYQQERDEDSGNINGVMQKGRDLSAINSAYADLFEGMTYNGESFTPSIYNPFESNHLNTGESRQDLLDMGVDPDVVDNSMAGGTSEWDSDTDTYRQIAPINLQTTQGSPDIVQSGSKRIVEGVNGTIFGADDEVPETIKRSRTDILRDNYLLGDLKDKNGNDMSTVQRVRLMRLEQGVVGGFGNRQIGGSPNISTPNMSTPIEEDQYRQYVAGDEGAADLAQELMEKYKAGLKNNG